MAGTGADGAEWESIVGWCHRELGSPARVRLFAGGHIAKVVGVMLGDGRQVVVKLRPPDARAPAVLAVQRRLFDRGFPCPEPLSGATVLGDMMASAEANLPAEELVGPPPPRECAEKLAMLVTLAGDPGEFPALASPLPWVAWDHPGPGRWPVPDDLDVDLDHPPGPPWLEDAAEGVRTRLAADRSPMVIGHCDWEAHNLGWRGRRIAVVYDWDSLGTRSEPALAGAAAAVFASARGGPVAADLQQSEAFLDAYQEFRGPFGPDAVEVAYAAGLWVMLYNARKELAGGGHGYLRHLGVELGHRSRMAGV